MTIEEFSDEFDVLVQAYATDAPLVFDEYEKSVFLTRAQEDVVRGLYDGTLAGQSIEETEKLRRFLDTLVKTNRGTKITSSQENRLGLTKDSVFFSLPPDLWYITYEQVLFDDKKMDCGVGNYALVTPVTQDEFYRLNKNPFRGSNYRRVLRLDVSGQGNRQVVELVSKYNIKEYLVRYLSKPTPIILIDLPDNMSIEDETSVTECKLNSVLHRIILAEAVRQAVATRTPPSADR